MNRQAVPDCTVQVLDSVEPGSCRVQGADMARQSGTPNRSTDTDRAVGRQAVSWRRSRHTGTSSPPDHTPHHVPVPPSTLGGSVTFADRPAIVPPLVTGLVCLVATTVFGVWLFMIENRALQIAVGVLFLLSLLLLSRIGDAIGSRWLPWLAVVVTPLPAFIVALGVARRRRGAQLALTDHGDGNDDVAISTAPRAHGVLDPVLVRPLLDDDRRAIGVYTAAAIVRRHHYASAVHRQPELTRKLIEDSCVRDREGAPFVGNYALDWIEGLGDDGDWWQPVSTDMAGLVLARAFHEMDYVPPGTPLRDETVTRLMRTFRAFLTKDPDTDDWIEIEGFDKSDLHAIPIECANRLVCGFVALAEQASKDEASHRRLTVWPDR